MPGPEDYQPCGDQNTPLGKDHELSQSWRTYMDQGYGEGRNPFEGTARTRTTHYASIEGDGDPMFRHSIDTPPNTVVHGNEAE